MENITTTISNMKTVHFVPFFKDYTKITEHYNRILSEASLENIEDEDDSKIVDLIASYSRKLRIHMVMETANAINWPKNPWTALRKMNELSEFMQEEAKKRGVS